MPKSGRYPGSAARAMLHVHGRYSSHVPVKQIQENQTKDKRLKKNRRRDNFIQLFLKRTSIHSKQKIQLEWLFCNKTPII